MFVLVARQFRARSAFRLLPSATRCSSIGRSFANKVESDSDFGFSDAEDINDAPIAVHTSDLMQTNLQRFERALELQHKGETLMREDNFDVASSAYISCIGTFNAFLEFKFGDADASVMNQQRSELLLDPTIGLAFAQQCLGRLEEAEETYKDAIELMKHTKVDNEKYVRCVVNYAELLCQSEKPLLAIENIKEAIGKLENKKTEIHASALSNLAIYYAVLKRYEEAIPYAKDGYELFCKILGKNNAYTENALKAYIRVLTEAGKEDEAKELHEEWEKSRRTAELPSNEAMEQKISQKVEESLSHFSRKKTFDPDGMIVPPEVLEQQKKIFEGQYKDADFGDPNFVESITPELKTLYDILGKSHEFHADLQKFKDDPKAAKEKLESGLSSPITSVNLTEFYESQAQLPKE